MIGNKYQGTHLLVEVLYEMTAGPIEGAGRVQVPARERNKENN